MSAAASTIEEAFPTPSAAEVKRTAGPIVKALADVVSPPGSGPAGRGYRERLRIDLESIDPRDDARGEAERDETVRRRVGVHAAACLAREVFGCPDLGAYDFSPCEGGMVSFGFDDALNAMDDLDGVGGMGWDKDGRFARFLADHGSDTRWLIAAASMVLVEGSLRDEGAPRDRNDVIEETHFRCREFTREYLSQVYGELAPLLRAEAREPRREQPSPQIAAPGPGKGARAGARRG